MTDEVGDQSASTRVAAWTAWIDQITRAVYALHHYPQLWRRLAEITRGANLPPSAFFDALTRWYSATQSIGVRRQLDSRRGTVSLIRLLQDIGRHPRTMTRERHVALWVGENEAAGNHTEAAALYAEAANRWLDFGNKPECAYALLGHGRCLTALGNHAGATYRVWLRRTERSRGSRYVSQPPVRRRYRLEGEEIELSETGRFVTASRSVADDDSGPANGILG